MKATRPVAGTRRSRGSATDDAYEHLKRRILVCELAPGAELHEVALVESTGFGRSPVREALRRLVQEGFVEVRPRQGYRVAPITLAAVRDIFELRLLVEPAAVELAARRAPRERVLGLRRLVHVSVPDGAADGDERFFLEDRRFHVGIAQVAGNDRLANLSRTLLEEVQRLFFFLGLDPNPAGSDPAGAYRAVHEALLAGDAGRAREVVVEQIQQSRRRVLDALVARVLDGVDLASPSSQLPLPTGEPARPLAPPLRQQSRIRPRSTARSDALPMSRPSVRGRSHL